MHSSDYARINRNYWTKRAPGYSAVNQEELMTQQKQVWGDFLHEQIQMHFGGRRPETIKVLDIGTGPGFFAILLAERGYRVTAIDYTAAMLEQAKFNAGSLEGSIQFMQMNAEELTFTEETFDVIVSRNLTWNLPDPHKAYHAWNSVLSAGGLLLNFDANWYRYLYDEEAKSGHLSDRENVTCSQVADDTAGTDVDAMEAIARKAPLSRRMRPDWDVHVLENLGMQVGVDREIWRHVWTEAERINNASTPMFSIRAVKAS